MDERDVAIAASAAAGGLLVGFLLAKQSNRLARKRFQAESVRVGMWYYIYNTTLQMFQEGAIDEATEYFNEQSEFMILTENMSGAWPVPQYPN